MKEGTLGVKFSSFQPVWGDYNVIDTDYDNYTFIYSCFSAGWGLIQQEYYWILTREPLSADSSKLADITA